MSNDVVDRLKNIEALVLALKEDRARPDSLQKILPPLIEEHADDLKYHLNLMLDAISRSDHAAGEDFEVQVNLINSQIENGFRNLAQNIAGNVNEYRNPVQQEFEEQVELLKRNNAEFVTALTRLTEYQDAQELLEKELFEREVELISQENQIERPESALDLAHSQGDTEGAEVADNWRLREAELVANHKREIRLFTAKYRALFEELVTAKGNIRVMVRIRREEASAEMMNFQNPEQDFPIWSKLRAAYQNDSRRLEVRDFEFQRVFRGDETNLDVFNEVKDFAESAALLGRTCTVMAYGATGTGKSYTFISEDGLIRSYIKLLFQIAEEQQAHYKYEFQISAVEIYLNRFFDLLQTSDDPKEKAEIRLNAESTTKLDSVETSTALLEQVIRRREVASTVQNATSSRSHFILTVKISKKSLINSEEAPVKGQIRFLDLAGSERVGKNSLTSGSGPQQTLAIDQGNDINKGLLDLGKGIRSLATKNNFVPSHNLTRYIRSSLSPGSRLLIVATVSSLTENQNNTLNTLRWSQDAIGRPSQGKLVTQARAPESLPPRNSKLPAASGSQQRDSAVTSATSSKLSTPTRRGAPNQGNTKR